MRRTLYKAYPRYQGALIQGQWYVHVLSLLTSTCIGTCIYYVQPLEVCAHTSLLRASRRYVHVPRYVHVRTYLGLFRGTSTYQNKPI